MVVLRILPQNLLGIKCLMQIHLMLRYLFATSYTYDCFFHISWSYNSYLLPDALVTWTEPDKFWILLFLNFLKLTSATYKISKASFSLISRLKSVVELQCNTNLT